MTSVDCEFLRSWTRRQLTLKAYIENRPKLEISPITVASYCVSGKNNHRIDNYITYAPVNEKSIAKIDSGVAPQLPTAHLDVSVNLGSKWGYENRDSVTEKFNSWATG